MARKMLRLGIIGMSPGNGHPYSWSAICNGYDAAAMEDCGFPVIPRYLEQQQWPQARLPGVQVTHCWTQVPATTAHLAKAGKIANMVEGDPASMIGAIDGLLLARDDAEQHLSLAREFLEAGLPVYIDKPVALSRDSLDQLYAAAQGPNQIFSCSAVAWSEEIAAALTGLPDLGPIHHISASCPKYWATYAMHVVEPVFRLLGRTSAPDHIATDTSGGVHNVHLAWAETAGQPQARADIAMTGELASPIAFDIVGANGQRRVVFEDSFSAFKAALDAFIAGIHSGKSASNANFLAALVDTVEQGMQQ